MSHRRGFLWNGGSSLNATVLKPVVENEPVRTVWLVPEEFDRTCGSFFLGESGGGGDRSVESEPREVAEGVARVVGVGLATTDGGGLERSEGVETS